MNIRDAFAEQAQRKQRAEAVLVAALRANGGTIQNKTNWMKIFWASHLVHMHRNGYLLSDWPIARLPRGPVPDDHKELLSALQERGVIEVRTDHTGSHPTSIVDEQAAEELVNSELDAKQIAVIEHVTRELANISAKEVSEWSHKNSRGWNSTTDGETFDPYLDLSTSSELDPADEQAFRDVFND